MQQLLPEGLAGIPLLATYVKPGDRYTPIQLEGNTVLAEQESRAFLATLGIKGEIISTPGHSDDSVTLILDEGAAFTGDLTPPSMVADDPSDDAFKSWERIRSMGVSTIYPGHGPAVRI